MKKLLITLTLSFPIFLLSSCTMDKAEMNRRGQANMAKAKQRHLDRIARQNGRSSGGSYSRSKTASERMAETRERGRIENNRVYRNSNNPYIRYQSR